MFTTIRKAMHHFWARPNHFASDLRGYALFAVTSWIGWFFLSSSRGIHRGSNVRIQRVSSISAERPNASVTLGANSVIYENAKIEAYGHGRIVIGESSIIGDARIYARGSIQIGARVVTSWNVFIQDYDPHPIDPAQRAVQIENMTIAFHPSRGDRRSPRPLDWTFSTDPIVIGDDVWLGANVTILKGAKIGSGTLVASGSLVTRGDWPANALLAGVPAKVIKIYGA